MMYVSTFGIIRACDKGFHGDIKKFLEEDSRILDVSLYDGIQADDVIWIRSLLLPQFVEKILPDIKVPVKLVISYGDENFPSDFHNVFDVNLLLNNHYLIRIFAQNCDIIHNKVVPIPIGLDFHTLAYRGGGWGDPETTEEEQDNMIHRLFLFSDHSKKKAFVDFQHSDTYHAEYQRHLTLGEDRKTIFENLPKDFVDSAPFMRRSLLWRRKSEYKYSICPHGGGWDTHRVWEDLVLGCRVIVKSSPMDQLYRELDTIIINDWNDNFKKSIHEYRQCNTDLWYKLLKENYWVDLIRNSGY